MATLVLQAAGQAVGGFLGPVGAIVGRAAGALVGNAIDQQLFGDNRTRTVGQIDDLTIQTASEGNPIPKVYGRMRLAGTVIWATDFEEHQATSSVGGKGGGPKVREYSYTANFAVGLCEGPIARIGRIWADGEPLDLADIRFRVHEGHSDQEPDPLIEGIEGVAPAYRGLAYVVFEQLPVGPFGNRLPQLTFEGIRPVGSLEKQIRAVTIIPGASEFGYHPDAVRRQLGPGEAIADNRHIGIAASDLDASLDELQALCPNLERVALVVAWFGDDLRVGSCTLTPRVEARNRDTDVDWSVAGERRDTAELVSATDERPNYGGTPSDNAVFAAIQAIKARGLKVVFYPFILMDVPPGNGLEDPYGGSEQAPFPWRGRVTVSPTPSRIGSPDGTATAEAAVASFVGAASAEHYSGSADTVDYSGPAEWSFSRMMLHYARLTMQAGGVDAFLVGSELRGLTTIRGSSGYPFVDALAELIREVRAIVGPQTKLSYAADWSEYFGHKPGDPEENNFDFHLDPIWADRDVDFVGIDNYWPLADWRDGSHRDEAIASDPYDLAYLMGNVAGGEGYDWFYADEADRDAQNRTPIVDAAYNKPWVYRYKDLAGWWSNRHHNRVDGREVAQPTSWIAGMKPVWFTEVGCPAIDRGANQPNVFYDPKSAESALPYYSSGRRDDAIQRAHVGAILSAYDPQASGLADRVNPVSSVYGGRMVELTGIHVWTWDARPWPAFPQRSDVWSDGLNWERGHWLNGRLGGCPIGDLAAAMFTDWGLAPPVVDGVPVVLDGFLVAGPQSLRSVLEPLLVSVSAVAADTGTAIRIVGLGRPGSMTLTEADLVEMNDRAPLVGQTREEAANLPVEVRLRYFDSGRSFQVASARYRPQIGSARQTDVVSVPASMNDGLAAELSELGLAVRWAGRTTFRFALPPSKLSVLPGDIVSLDYGGLSQEVVVEEIEDLGYRLLTARSVDRTVQRVMPVGGSSERPAVPSTVSPPVAFGLNLPRIDANVPDHTAWIGVFSRPFPAPMGVWRAVPGGSFQLLRTIERPASLGEAVSAVPPGPTGRWHYGGHMDVRLYNARVSSAPDVDVLNGQNALAVRSASGVWEVIQFRDARLIGERTYRLSALLRGQLGTDDATAAGIAKGAPVALLDGTLATLRIDADEIGLTRTYRVGPLSEGVGGRNVTTFDFVGTGRALIPYSPRHGDALLRTSDQSLLLSWIGRTRVGGDGWSASGQALGGTDERYRLEILDESSVVRSVDTTQPFYRYSLVDQRTDFGEMLRSVTYRVSQISSGFGPGVPYEVTVDVREP